jgi:hypothetical protein
MGGLKLKGVAGKLGVLKDFVSLIIAAVIVLIAIIILAITPLLMGSKLKKEIESKSIKNGNSIMSLVKSKIPSNVQWQEEQKYQDAYSQDANDIARLFLGSSRRALLSYMIFPEPKDSSTFIFEEFGTNFRKGIEEQLATIGAGDCPSQAELEEKIESRAPSGGGRFPGGRFSSGSMGRTTGEDVKLEDALCQDRARKAKVYAAPADFAGYDFNFDEIVDISTTLQNCWYWQVGYWIIEDVISTTDQMNRDSKNVLSSPVKRIVNVSFSRMSQSYRASTIPGRGMGIGAGIRSFRQGSPSPSYVVKEYGGLAETCTNRISNEKYDIVHFIVVVIVRADSVQSFIEDLCSSKEHTFKGFSGTEASQVYKHNQISVLDLRIRPVDRTSVEHYLFRYGENAVVELSLTCEYLFDLKGYSPVKPASVTETQASGKTRSTMFR